MDSKDFDVVIIGGGIVGLSTAMQLTREGFPNWKIGVVEKEAALATMHRPPVAISQPSSAQPTILVASLTTLSSQSAAARHKADTPDQQAPTPPLHQPWPAY